MADLEMLKEIPGYKAILKSVLKSQIQLMLEQLADHTGEESIILTASVHDGSLSHLGSCTGKGFLEGREEIKSQFLGYCLKTHHKAKTHETRGSPYQRNQPGPRSHSQKMARLQSGYPSMSSQNTPGSSYDSGGGAYQSSPLTKSETKYGRDSQSSSYTTQTMTSTSQSDLDPSAGQFHIESKSTPSMSNPSNMPVGDQDGTSQSGNQSSSDIKLDTSNIKIEAMAEGEMDLEITGVEMGSGGTPDDWGQRAGMMDPGSSDTGDQSEYKYFHHDDAQKSGKKQPLHVYVCEQCNKVFPHKNDFTRHLRIHTGEKPFSCDYCTARFNRKHHLSAHMVTKHSGKSPYWHSRNITESYLEHTPVGSLASPDPKPGHSHSVLIEQSSGGFACELCSKVLKNRESMRKHMMIHSGLKPFVCNVCGKSFRQKHHMQGHMVIVHKEN